MTNHEKHILLWDELARTGSNDKYSTFHQLFSIEETVIACCWACHECEGKCSECPIDWGSDYCDCDEAPYDNWSMEKNTESRKLLAAQIRDLPWVKK